MGRTGDGGYAVIIGGVVDRQGKLENHGRWLPYPMLVPMMVGTAMSLEKDYYSSDAAMNRTAFPTDAIRGLGIEGTDSHFYWAAHQLARKMTMQMAELTQSCPDLQAVFDLAALIRMPMVRLPKQLAKSSRPSVKLFFPPRAAAPRRPSGTRA